MPLQAQTPRDFAVDLSTTVSTSAPCITLAWTQRRQGNITAQRLHRRLKGETVWVKQADLATNQTSYVDATAAPYTEYEYWMERTFSGIYPATAMGYLSAGVCVPASEARGKLLLVVDSTMAAPLAPEIAQLQADLTGDGWTVQALTATRTDTAANTKALIKTAYDADPANVKMVYLLGHVPVPYSGNINPDGHGNHLGAWPADGYYGDMTGTWTDTSVNNTSASDTRNRNIPGDGKFDQSTLPAPLKLMVGRVDLSNMTRAPAPAASETSLLRRYLRKAHDFRFKLGAYAAVPRRSLMRDGFGYFGGENFAIAGWGWFFSGAGSTVDEAPSDQWFAASYAGGKSYLVGYGNGGGSYDTAGGVGNSVDFGLKTSRVVFTSLFGSYLGDWDSGNNFMRAPLAGNATGDSLGLTCFWGGRPNRFMHPLGMGETAGYAMLISHNGSLSGGGGYTPNNYAGVHCGLMGDPALRLHAVEPPRNLAASSAGAQVTLVWSASTESNLLGYLVFRAAAPAGPFTRLTADPLAAPAYTDASVTAGQSYSYLVRTLKLETSPGGSYNNLSVGALLTLTANAGATAAPRNPTALTVTQTGAANAQLAWTDNAGDETGFRIERKTNAGGSYVAVGTSGASVTNFTDPGTFTQGNVYYYRVIATGAAGESPPSNEAAFDAAAGFFDLPATRIKVSKAAGTATITVNRFGGATGAASVNFATANSSALAGTHYTAANGTLTWADGETGAKTFSVPIINTAAPQAARQFKVNLSSPSGGTGYTVNSSVAVLIEDPTAALAAPWSQTIIGGITDNSAAVLTGGEFGSVTIGGSGLSSGATAEAGRFIYQSRDGDGILTSYFPAGIPSDGNARVAVMVRASTANNAIMAAAATSASTSFGSLLSTRSAAGGGAAVQPASANALTLARWMRLTRAGSVFTAETSADGSAWTLLGSATLDSMPATAQWGLFHCSSDWSVTGLGNYHLALAQSLTLTGLPLPASPTGLSATATSPSSITLTWDTVANAAGYRIERRDESHAFAQVADVTPGTGTTQTKAEADLSAETAYAYRVSAYNSSGTSAPSASAYAATPSPDVTSSLTTAGAGAADATVRRDMPSTPLGSQTNLTVACYDPLTYLVMTNAAKSYLRFNLAGAGAFTAAKLKLAFVGADRFDDSGYLYNYLTLLGESSDTWDENTITWTNAPQNNMAGYGFTGSSYAVGYSDYLDVLPAAGEVVSVNLAVATLNAYRGANNLVTLVIHQYDGATAEWASREHPSFAPPTLELSASSTLPARASFLTAVPGNGFSAVLQWRDNAANEAGFELERSAGGGAFALLQTFSSNTVSFIDTATQPAVTYAYRIRTVNASGASSWTPVASITTPDFFHAGGTLWDGGGANTLIDTAANWDFDSLPAFDGSAYFNFGAGGSAATVNTNIGFLGLSLHRDGDFTFANGGGTLTLGSGGLRAAAPNATSRTYTLAANVALAADQTWGVTNNGAGVTTLTVSGPVSDGAAAFGITLAGNGPITFAGNSTYDGPTVVLTGAVLRVTHANALGSTNGETSVMFGGGLEIAGGVSVPDPLTLNGDGTPGGAGALRSPQGTNVWGGLITQTAASRVRVLAGSRLTLAGGLTGSAGVTLAPDAGAELAFTNGPINIGSSGKVSANGAGTVAFGMAGNTFGTLEVAGLTLRTDLPNTLPPGSILSLGTAYSPHGTCDLNGNSQTVSQLKRGTTGAGTRILTSAAPATLTVNGNASTTYDGRLTGALGLTYNGSASYTLVLAGANTYSGATAVGGGTLEISSSSSLGSSLEVSVANGTLRLRSANAIQDAAALSISGSGKVRIESGTETVDRLYIDGVRKPQGTWGASGSGADTVDDAHFLGAGMLYVPPMIPGTVWDGGGSDTGFDNPNNWNTDWYPNLDGTASVQLGSGGTQATMNTHAALLGLLFNRDADFTLADGGGILTLGSGGLRAAAPNATPRTYTLAASVALAADQTWGVTNNGAGATTLVVSGAVSDGPSAFGITACGDGVLTLAGNSSYDGATAVAAGGVLRVISANALGSTNGSTTVVSNGAVEICGGVTVPEPLTIGDSGSGGALRSTGGTNTWSGPVTQTAASRIRVLAGSRLTLAGGLTGGTATYLSPDAGAELALGCGPVNVGSSGKVCANGAGTVALGMAGNTFGTLEVAGLTVRADLPQIFPPGAILSIGTAFSPHGTFDLNGNSQTVGQLKRGTTGAGTRIVTSAAPATLTVNGSASTTYDGRLTGALGLTYNGPAYTLTLAGANTYSGATTISGGTLDISSSSSLGSSSVITVTGGTLSLKTQTGVADSASLRIADGGGAKVNMNSGMTETVGTLYLGGRRQRRGTYGATAESGATTVDAVHFSGTGAIRVLYGPESVIMVR